MTLPADPIASDRLMAMMREVVRLEMPRLTYLSPWEYRVSSTDDGPPVTIDAKSTAPEIVPDIPKLVLRPGPDGAYARPSSGSSIIVRFVNGDPTRPYVDSLDPDATVERVWMPATEKVKIAGGGADVARVGDVVNAGYLVVTSIGAIAVSTGANGYFPATPAGLSAATTAAGALIPPGSVTSMTDGRITSGSSKTESG